MRYDRQLSGLFNAVLADWNGRDMDILLQTIWAGDDLPVDQESQGRIEISCGLHGTERAGQFELREGQIRIRERLYVAKGKQRTDSIRRH